MKTFLELLQVSIGNRENLSVTPSEETWIFIYDLSKKHSLLGITFAGIEKLVIEQRPARMLLLQWAGACEKIIEINKIISEKCGEVNNWFENKGFDSCILKGQGNNDNYPCWLKGKRNPGDIDIWVWPKDYTNNIVKRIINCCKVETKIDKVHYHHMEFPIMGDIDVEVHFRPSWMSSPIINRRLQRWFEEEKVKIVEYNEHRNEGFSVPTPAFNVMYQLIHIYRHLFDGGVGFRQIIDYYFVLESYYKTKPENDDLVLLLKRFNLFSFAGAMMYVLKKALKMPETYMICEPDARRGRHLLREIMMAGNFGWYDNRIKRFHEIKGLGGVNKILQEGHNFFNKNIRNLKMLSMYPNEVLWTPYFMVYHWFWRKLKLWNYSLADFRK